MAFADSIGRSSNFLLGGFDWLDRAFAPQEVRYRAIPYGSKTCVDVISLHAPFAHLTFCTFIFLAHLAFLLLLRFEIHLNFIYRSISSKKAIHVRSRCASATRRPQGHLPLPHTSFAQCSISVEAHVFCQDRCDVRLIGAGSFVYWK